MKVAGNKLAHLSDFFHDELDPLLEKEEVSVIFRKVIAHFLPIKSNEVNLRLNDNLNQSELVEIYDCCKELKKGRPLQFILGEEWFYGMRFLVNEYVLIPRPETEELCELIIRENKNCKTLLDIGTGSGCIAVAIKKKIPNCEVSATDISEGALELAKKNAGLNDVKVNFSKNDILSDKNELFDSCIKFELIVSNPPYIKQNESASLLKNVIDHEPHSALFVSGSDEIIFYKKIIDSCKQILELKGKLYFELNPLTAEKVLGYANKSGIFKEVELRKDMSKNIRFLIACK